MLTTKQRRIIELLCINCRFTNKDIAKELGLSEDAVRYQVQKLIEEEKLSRFIVTFNNSMLGYKRYHLFIQLGKTSFSIEKLKAVRGILSINTSYGAYDLQIIFLAKTLVEKKRVLKDIESILSITNQECTEFMGFYKKFSSIHPSLSLNTKIPKNQKNYVYSLNSRSFPEQGTKKIVLDDIDKKIVKELLERPRASYLEMQRATGINHETIRYRIKKMVSTGFIRNFGLVHNFKKYKFYMSYLLLKTTDLDANKFSAFLDTVDDVFYAAKLKGKYSCILYISSKDPTQLSEIFKKVREYLQDKLVLVDLLHMVDFEKYIQFAYWELEDLK